jgi:hypothetical protein
VGDCDSGGGCGCGNGGGGGVVVVVVALMLWSGFCGLSCCVTSIWHTITITITTATAIATAAATVLPVDSKRYLCDSNSISCSAAQSLSPSAV